MGNPIYRGEIYQGKDEEWYWRLLATNGRIVADGSQGYIRRCDAVKMFCQVNPGRNFKVLD